MVGMREFDYFLLCYSNQILIHTETKLIIDFFICLLLFFLCVCVCAISPFAIFVNVAISCRLYFRNIQHFFLFINILDTTASNFLASSHSSLEGGLELGQYFHPLVFVEPRGSTYTVYPAMLEGGREGTNRL